MAVIGGPEAGLVDDSASADEIALFDTSGREPLERAQKARTFSKNRLERPLGLGKPPLRKEGAGPLVLLPDTLWQEEHIVDEALDPIEDAHVGPGRE